MGILSLYRNFCIQAVVRGSSLRDKAARLLINRRVLGFMLIGAPAAANAAGVSDMLKGWSEGANAAIEFAVLACLLVGLTAVGYGCKLIVDKSQERGDVKNSQILFAMVGGSLLCVIWFIITILVETSGGSSGDIGQTRTF